MMIWLLALWGRLKGWLLLGAAILAAIAGAWLRGRHQGRQGAEQERERERIEAMREAKGIDDEVEALADADLDRRFRRWMRGDP
jgi:hypothetical protein